MYFSVRSIVLVICLSALSSSTMFGESRCFAEQQEEVATVKLPELRLELLRRSEVDQEARRAMMGNGGAVDFSKFGDVSRIDKENREWLKEQVKEHGWPGKSLVGGDGAGAAWLLVQHADADRAFQRECLDLMTEAGPDEVNAKNLAYLTDRVLLAEGKPQRYGTQFSMKNGNLEMRDCENRETLDKRRAELGLGTIAEYKKIMAEAYKNQLDTDEKVKKINNDKKK